MTSDEKTTKILFPYCYLKVDLWLKCSTKWVFTELFDSCSGAPKKSYSKFIINYY